MNGMDKLELYVVRHGETEWNKEGRLQGWLDSDLTAKGIKQAKQLRKKLELISFDAAYASTSKRAYETANILVGDVLPINTDSRLQEIYLGNWQGKFIHDIEREDRERYDTYCHKPAEYIPDSGENIEQVMKRMHEFFQECVERHEKGRVLIVSHGVAIRALLLTLLHWPIEKLWDFNEIVGASVTKIVVNSKGIDVDYIGKESTDMTNS